MRIFWQSVLALALLIAPHLSYGAAAAPFVVGKSDLPKHCKIEGASASVQSVVCRHKLEHFTGVKFIRSYAARNYHFQLIGSNGTVTLKGRIGDVMSMVGCVQTAQLPAIPGDGTLSFTAVYPMERWNEHREYYIDKLKGDHLTLELNDKAMRPATFSCTRP